VLARFLALDPRRRVLVANALTWVLASRLALWFRRPLGEQQSLLDKVAAELPSLSGFTAGDAAWAVTAVAKRVPGTRCLAWSLALRGLLRQSGVICELRIGVARGESDDIKAHAWIESAEQKWSWGDSDRYSVLKPRGVARVIHSDEVLSRPVSKPEPCSGTSGT